VHDAGAFQLGIGITLLLALAWRDEPALVLAGFLVANVTHAVNHAVDLSLSGRAWNPWGLAALSLVTAIALVVRLGQLGWVVGEVGTAATPALVPFVRQETVLLTSHRRDGRPVDTPEHRRRRPRLSPQLREGREDPTDPHQPEAHRRTVDGAWHPDWPGRPGHSQAPGWRRVQARRCWPASTHCCTGCSCPWRTVLAAPRRARRCTWS
jgi:hypothetical protein